MNTDIFNIISNYSYLIAGLYLIYNKKYLYGVFAMLIWLISHIYHSTANNKLWGWEMNMDIIFSSIIFLIILIKCNKILLCFKNIFLLLVLLLLFMIGYYYYYIDINIYNIIHSLWHVASACFVIYIIMNNNEEFAKYN
jgi:hypothetical protein